MFICFLLSISLLLNEIPLYVYAKAEGVKENAVMWLTEEGGKNQCWGNDGLHGLTCDAMAVLHKEGIEIDSTYLKQWEQEHTALNVDELAHLAWGWKDKSYLDTVWKWQNDDGGFGLSDVYTSDVYDTLLVLSAFSAVSENTELEQEEVATEEKNIPEAVQGAVNYLIGQQRADGGFGYTAIDAAHGGLSAEIGFILLSLDMGDDAFYEKLDAFCLDMFKADFSEDAFLEQAELARYLYKRDKIKDADTVEQKLYATQKEDGSIYGKIQDTIQYILLVEELEEYHSLRFKTDSLVTEADTYVLEADKEQKVSLQTTVQYTVNQKITGILRYTLLEDGDVLKIEEKECTFVPEQTEHTAGSSMDITAVEGKEYILRTELVSKDGERENVWKSTDFSFTVHKTIEQEFLLQAKTSSGEDYTVNLSWNDISDGDNRYGYRVFRKKGDGEWETRSTWDGEEKVRVLNIYPCYEAKNYLVNWMEETVSDLEEPAGKGLFEIDTVFIGDYNNRPDSYLMDEEGNYQYDVLVFGTYDSNAFWDLSQESYDATQRFLDTGRGALFGHDTVAQYYGNHKTQFPKFGERMGIKLIADGHLKGGNKVKVVKSGILTNYPWKLTGTLTIPDAHVAGQYAGGTLPSVAWMEFQCDYLTDAETGAKNNAYLFSKDAVAMIQTGHSNGQATDDERKILANTLFYLKQFTDKTSASDKSFYDETAPEVTGISEVTADNRVTVQAADYGTLYQYYVEAVNTGSRDEEGRRSNIAEAEAVSGIRGFIIGTSDSEEIMGELLTYDEGGNLTSEVLPADGGSLEYTIEGVEPGQSTYLHIYAVDYAGNVSEEAVHQITLAKAEKEYFKLPYALFAGKNEVQLYCSEANIAGDIYGAETFRFQGSTIHMPDTVSTTGELSIAGGILDIAEELEGVEAQQLPDYMPIILSDMEAEGDPLEELNAYNSTDIITPTICKKTTGAWCNNVTLAASLVSGDTVSFNANTITCGEDTPVVLGSENGDIRIQATKFGGSGLIYAPNGTVTINVSEFNYTGSIVAKRIVIQAGYYNQNQ